jgi:2-polyprenyl-3-methyl-5-hydroxy-6-metoxy-1,4-benzoquinol methylase
LSWEESLANVNLIFIVAYNHERFIEKVVGRIPREVLEDPNNELLIIDDASRDDTFRISDAVRRSAPAGSRVTVLRNPVNQGYGGNQKLGYEYAVKHQFERVFLIHGDGQYAPELLVHLIAEYSGPDKPDAVFGSRMMDWQSPLRGGMPVYKFVGNKILTALQNMLVGTQMSEFHSGYRSYSTALLRRIPFERNSNDFHFDTEIILQAQAVGARIKEVPIPTHYGDEVCNVDGMKYARNVIKASLHYRLQTLGMLYDRKFDLGEHFYPMKSSPFSSHSRIIARMPSGAHVLDLGCGRGFIAEQMIAKGCVVDGIDMLDRGSVRAPLRRYLQADLNNDRERIGHWLNQKAYDYVVMADVLEHLVDPESFLDILRANLRRERSVTVIATTGNVGFFIVRGMLALGQFNYGPRGILDRTHTRLFTRKSFRGIFEQAGYDVQLQTGLPLSASAVLGDDSRVARLAESVNAAVAARRPGLFAYQLWLEAQPFPTVDQMLDMSHDHSAALRTNSASGLVANGRSSGLPATGNPPHEATR